MEKPPVQLHVREGCPDFLDLPWDLPLAEWSAVCDRVEEAPRGLSRHPGIFINYRGSLFALKELPVSAARDEYRNLEQMQDLRLPAVKPVAHGSRPIPGSAGGEAGILITRYLDYSLPYRTLFTSSALDRYREHLLDAMAGLLVQLHLAGVFWGDCSLSNTLFRRDAGALQAYLVDAETSEVHPGLVSPTLRHHELQIMESNVDRDVNELVAANIIYRPANFSLVDMGEYIRMRYQQVWEEITREEIIHVEERYRIQERIRALNRLGFSVGGVELYPTEAGEKLRLRLRVTDRNFHQDQLLDLTGLKAEEHQAVQIMNEIQQVRAGLSQENERETPLSVAAFHWYEQIYLPVVSQAKPMLEASKPRLNAVELYCQILEHKWYLSEKAHRDVGHRSAAQDYLDRFKT
jgi:hypothetical protein